MTVLQENSEIDDESTVELTTVDNIIIQLQTDDFNFFSKYPESTLWAIYERDGLIEFKKFVKKYLTKTLFEAIIYFYNYDKWPHPISILNIFNPYNFLNLPTYTNACDNNSNDYNDDSSIDIYNNDSSDDNENSSDGM